MVFRKRQHQVTPAFRRRNNAPNRTVSSSSSISLGEGQRPSGGLSMKGYILALCVLFMIYDQLFVVKIHKKLNLEIGNLYDDASKSVADVLVQSVAVEGKKVTDANSGALSATTATDAKKGDSMSDSIQSSLGIAANPTGAIFYDSPPDLSLYPQWIQDYILWHKEQRAKFSGMKLFTDPEAPNLLIRVCLGLCGGLHDRIGQLPWDLYLAHKTKRVLLMAWQRPKSLENFLVPGFEENFNWTVPYEAKFGFDDMRYVRNLTQLFQDYGDDRPEKDFWDKHVDAAIERANTGKYKNVKILRHRILGHLGEKELEARLVKEKLASNIEDAHRIHSAPLFGNIFWLFFKPSPAVDNEFRSVLKQLQMIPNHYTAVHCRVRHPKATELLVLGKNPKYPADKTGLPWEGETRQFAIDTARKALSCATHISKDRIYFLSDSNDLVRHVAFELNGDEKFMQANSTLVDEKLYDIIQNKLEGGITARDVTLENAHIDRQKGRDPPAYYATFVDLLLAIHAKCVVYGIGYYAVFAAKISGTTCKLLYQQEAWGKQGDKQAQICTKDMWEI